MQPLSISFITLVLLMNSLRKTETSPANKSHEVVVQVPRGETVTIQCESNDKNHNFFYWYLEGNDAVVVGPSNEYDSRKFRYEVLTGKLTIRAVSKHEEGVYICVSQGTRKNNINIRSVRMKVKDDWETVYENDPNVNLFRVVVVLSTLMVLGGVTYAGYRIWKNRYRNPSYLVPSDEEEDSGDELFRAPGTSRSADNTARSNPEISTDFTSILDTANNK